MINCQLNIFKFMLNIRLIYESEIVNATANCEMEAIERDEHMCLANGAEKSTRYQQYDSRAPAPAPAAVT